VYYALFNMEMMEMALDELEEQPEVTMAVFPPTVFIGYASVSWFFLLAATSSWLCDF
jgi:hypothetical protein